MTNAEMAAKLAELEAENASLKAQKSAKLGEVTAVAIKAGDIFGTKHPTQAKSHMVEVAGLGGFGVERHTDEWWKRVFAHQSVIESAMFTSKNLT